MIMSKVFIKFYIDALNYSYFKAVCVRFCSNSNPDHISKASWKGFPNIILEEPTSIPKEILNKLIYVAQYSSSRAAHFFQLDIKRHLYITHSKARVVIGITK